MLGLERITRRLFGVNGKAARAPASAPDRAMVPLYRSIAPIGTDSSADELYRHYRGWTYVAVKVIAQTVAGLGVKAARARRPGSPAGGDVRKDYLPGFVKSRADDLEIVPDHPVLALLERPNPIMSQWALFYLTICHLELVGRSVWWCTPDGDGQLTVWPLPATWVQPDHSSGVPFGSWRLRPGGAVESRTIPAAEIVHFAYVDPTDPLSCYSPTRAAGRAILADESIQTAQTAAFRNGVIPTLALIAGDVTDEEGGGVPLLEAEQRQQLIQAVQSRYAGVEAAGKPLILDRLIKDVRKISSTPNEMSFLDSGKSTKARILESYGVNPVVAGALEGVNRASSAVARKHFGEFCINPKVELLSQVLTASLAPKLSGPDEKLYVWLEKYTPDDREMRRRDAKLLVEAGAISRNELRSLLLNLPPLETEGDMIPTKPGSELLPVRGKSKAVSKDSARRVWLRHHSEREAALQKVLEKLFAEQRQDVLRRLRELGAVTDNPDTIFVPDDWPEKFAPPIRQDLLRSMLTGAYSVLQQVTKSAPTVDDLMAELSPKVRAKIEAELNTIMSRPYWTELHQTTRTELAKALQQGVAEGESLYQLSVRIGDGVDGVLGEASNTVRALRIARSETTMGLNAGQWAQQKDLIDDGVIESVEWLAVVDNYTRPEHAALNGKSPPFILGGVQVDYPGDPALPGEHRINCRCTILPVVD